jgi:formylglycine-generating enzyme required for sulfatase activity
LDNFTATVLSDGDRVVTIPDSEVKITMKPVTGGVFYMGFQCDDPAKPNYNEDYVGDNNNDEDLCNLVASLEKHNNITGYNTVHKVALNSFYMSKTEVTQKQFETVMVVEASTVGWKDDFNQGEDYPAYYVSWYDAIAFCNKLSLLESKTPCYAVDGITDWGSLEYSAIPMYSSDASILAKWDDATYDFTANGYRLPTEAEWEYAARGGQKDEYTRTLGVSGTQYVYSGSNTIGDVAWYLDNNIGDQSTNGSNYGTKEVATLAHNDLGLYDMSGNLWEWCWDELGGYVYCCIENPDSPDPNNTSFKYMSSSRVHRGGYYGNHESYCRVSRRSNSSQGYRSNYTGIRVVCNAD